MKPNYCPNCGCHFTVKRVASKEAHPRPRIAVKGKSGFRGLRHWAGKWRAGICVRGHFYDLGYYSTPEEAARAYDMKALELLGPETPLNFPSNGAEK